MESLRTKYDINGRRAFRQRRPFLTRDAATDADQQIGPALFELPPTP